MPQAVQGVFPDRRSAERAAMELQAAGFDGGGMRLASLERPPRRPRRETVTVRSIVGGVIGALVLGSIGAIIAWIAAQAFIGQSTFAVIAIALVGGMIGWVLGSMLFSGVQYEEGYFQKERFELGRTVLAVQAPGREQLASNLLTRNGATDVHVEQFRRMRGVPVPQPGEPTDLGGGPQPTATA